SILRRTTDSLNWEGKTLLEIPPHKDIIGVLKLTERESNIIQERARAAKASVMSANESGKFLTTKFYLEYRTAVGYAKEQSDAPNPVFNTFEEWLPMRSTKMDVCAQICSYYLWRDDVLDVSFNNGVPVFPSLEDAPKGIGNKTRQILIYAEFPSMTPLLRNVLDLYEVPSLAIDGTMSFDKRDGIITQFHTPGSPRALIFSSVGSVGLNLAIADVVIFFDQPWSAQDERQIRGRAHRQPQKKIVKVFHLLAGDSSDILMNAMARGKRDMFDAFVNKELGREAELNSLLSGKSMGDDPDELQIAKEHVASDSEVVEVPTKRKRKPTTRNQKKSGGSKPTVPTELCDEGFVPADGQMTSSEPELQPVTRGDKMPAKGKKKATASNWKKGKKSTTIVLTESSDEGLQVVANNQITGSEAELHPSTPGDEVPTAVEGS
ncbi:hypothetical protein BYT27DRAFT_7216694, partial [Phlegmacium glaucopus]